MSIPRDLVRLTIVLATVATVAAAITSIVTLARSRRTEGGHEYHPWDHTVAPSDSAR